jgi:uncharacterized C2H2 Zn-finger protein
MAKSEGSQNPAEVQIGDNPKHKMLMAWTTTDELGAHQIHYHHGSMGFGTSAHNYSMHEGDDFVGTMGLDHKGVIQHIEIHPEKRRQGLATKLYKFGHEINEDIPSIPSPKHSESRTASGNEWATKVGGEVPKARGGLVPDEDFRHNRWGQLRETAIPKLKSHINEFHSKMMENGMDSESVAEAKFHVDSAHEYLTRAHEVGKEHRSYSDHMNKAHEHIGELGDLHENWYGNMDDHDKLQEHISKLY